MFPYNRVTFKPIEFLGEGSYGAVISAYDNKLKMNVAIKQLAPIEDLVRYLDKIIKILDRC